MFGVVHILAVDGFSGKVVSLVSTPRKNCVMIYEHVYLQEQELNCTVHYFFFFLIGT